MNSMLQRHCAKFIYIVPDGLRELMSDISREVIRSQPVEIYTFIADYLDALMITRENARIALRLVQSISEIAETTVDLLVRCGIDREEANKIAAIIQINFREYLSRKKSKGEGEGEGETCDILGKIMAQLEVNEEKLTDVAQVIQRAYRSFKERQQRERDMLFGMVDWRIAAKSAIALYRRTGVTMYEANRAATLIKAAYKGYYTRRVRKKLMQESLQEEIGEQFLEQEPGITEVMGEEDAEFSSYTQSEGTTKVTEPTEDVFEEEDYLTLDAEQEDEGFTYTEVADESEAEEARDEFVDEEAAIEESVGEEAVMEVSEGVYEEAALEESVGEEALMEMRDEDVDEEESVSKGAQIEESVDVESKVKFDEDAKIEEEGTEAASEHVDEELYEETTGSEFTTTYTEQEPDEQEDITENVSSVEQSEEEG